LSKSSTGAHSPPKSTQKLIEHLNASTTLSSKPESTEASAAANIAAMMKKRLVVVAAIEERPTLIASASPPSQSLPSQQQKQPSSDGKSPNLKESTHVQRPLRPQRPLLNKEETPMTVSSDVSSIATTKTQDETPKTRRSSRCNGREPVAPIKK
jgi:hypothetical protein